MLAWPRGRLSAAKREKLHYRAHGIEAALLVDPENQAVELFEGADHRVLEPFEIVTFAALPGFSLPLADLFAGLEET